jgi:FAD/FMN-containing dehydrogenase
MTTTSTTTTSTTTTSSTTTSSVLARPGDPRYAEATATYNLASSLRPTAAVTARTAEDVVAAVRAAREAGLAVRAQTTGHGAGSQAPLDGTVLVRTALDTTVRVDPGTRVAHVPAGATWADLVGAAEPYGLAALHGSSPTVGAIGNLLGGGISFYGRGFGVAANHVVSISLVLADGRQVVASAEQEPELFWALRGGGGGFGVVTALDVELVEMAAVLTGGTFWDARDAAVVAPLWEAWTAAAPEEVTTSLRLMNLPPLPGVPPVLTGRQVLVLDGAVQIQQAGDLDRAHRVTGDLLAPLRAAATPVLDTWHVASPSGLLMTHLDPPDPIPYAGEHALLDRLGATGVARFLEAAGPGSGTTIVSAELRQLGGAFATPTRAGGAFDRTDAAFAYVGLGITDGSAATAEDLTRIAAATAPWRTGFTAPTFVEGRTQPQRTFDDATAARVADVRRSVDPDGLFAGGVTPLVDAR